MKMRNAVVDAKRIVIKIGSSSLTDSGAGLDAAAVDRLVDVVALAKKRGIEVLVVSSGAIAAGLAPLGRLDEFCFEHDGTEQFLLAFPGRWSFHGVDFSRGRRLPSTAPERFGLQQSSKRR